MAKLKTDPIQVADLNEYLDAASDFSFEMSVLQRLRERGLACEHSGHYEDPVTGKSREFDLRALYDDGIARVRYAIECKNIRDYFPILVSCVRRTKFESYVDVAALIAPRIDSLMGTQASRGSVVRSYPLQGPNLYREWEWVGKKIAQIGRTGDQANAITANDSEVYEKWGQAVASAHDLVKRIPNDHALTEDGNIGFGFVFPLVVVPDDRLWAVHYEEDGTVCKAPHKVNRVSFYIGKEYKMNDTSIRLSHLEILTETGLLEFVDRTTNLSNMLTTNMTNRIRIEMSKIRAPRP